MEFSKAEIIQQIKSVIESKPRTIIKSTPRVERVDTEEHTTDSNDKQDIYHFDGVHLSVYDYFSMSPSTVSRDDVNKLQKIYQTALGKNGDIKSAMRKINNLVMKISRSETGQARLTNVYNHIKIRELQ